MQLKDMFNEIIDNTDVEILVFNTGEELCDLLTDGKRFDIIFLDIELCEINGAPNQNSTKSSTLPENIF